MAELAVGVVDAPSRGVTPHVGREDGIRRCFSCEKWFQETNPGQRYCSRRCKDRAYNLTHPVARQKALPLDPAPAPLPPVRDQRVPRERRPTMSGASLRIYRRLQEGPVSNWELAAMFPPAAAWRTRLSDVRWALRAADGAGSDSQPIGHYDCGGGLVWHWLEAKP